MSAPNKRHYRVAKNTKIEEDDSICLKDDYMEQLTCVGIIVYTVSIVISMALGYLIAKTE